MALNLELMPLVLVENLVIMFDPNNPQGNAPEKMSYFKARFLFLLDAVTKHIVLRVKFNR